MAPDSVAPPELPSVGQRQEDAWMEQRGEGGVEVLLQVLLQQALLRKLFLKKKGEEMTVTLMLHVLATVDAAPNAIWLACQRSPVSLA